MGTQDSINGLFNYLLHMIDVASIRSALVTRDKLPVWKHYNLKRFVTLSALTGW